MVHPAGVQALELHVIVDDTIVRAQPALLPFRGQRVEFIALGEAQPPARVAPVAGGLLGQIKLKDDYDTPLPEDVRHKLD